MIDREQILDAMSRLDAQKEELTGDDKYMDDDKGAAMLFEKQGLDFEQLLELGETFAVGVVSKLSQVLEENDAASIEPGFLARVISGVWADGVGLGLMVARVSAEREADLDEFRLYLIHYDKYFTQVPVAEEAARDAEDGFIEGMVKSNAILDLNGAFGLSLSCDDLDLICEEAEPRELVAEAMSGTLDRGSMWVRSVVRGRLVGPND